MCDECLDLDDEDEAQSGGVSARQKQENFDTLYHKQELEEAMLGERAFQVCLIHTHATHSLSLMMSPLTLPQQDRGAGRLGRNGRTIRAPKVSSTLKAPVVMLSQAERATAEAKAEAAAAALLAELDHESTSLSKKAAKQKKPAKVSAATPASNAEQGVADAQLHAAVLAAEEAGVTALDALKQVPPPCCDLPPTCS